MDDLESAIKALPLGINRAALQAFLALMPREQQRSVIELMLDVIGRGDVTGLYSIRLNALDPEVQRRFDLLIASSRSE